MSPESLWCASCIFKYLAAETVPTDYGNNQNEREVRLCLLDLNPTSSKLIQQRQ